MASRGQEEHLKELRAYFCAVDGDGKLVMSKPEVFDMISGKKGREELAKSFKEGNRFTKKKWPGVITQQIGKPFEGFIKYMESKKYSEPSGVDRYEGTNTTDALYEVLGIRTEEDRDEDDEEGETEYEDDEGEFVYEDDEEDEDGDDKPSVEPNIADVRFKIRELLDAGIGVRYKVRVSCVCIGGSTDTHE